MTSHYPFVSERQVRYLDEHPECVMVGSRVTIIDPDGDALTEMGDALWEDIAPTTPKPRTWTRSSGWRRSVRLSICPNRS